MRCTKLGPGRLERVDIDVPDKDDDGVTRSWDEGSFAPWRAYQESR